MTEPRDAAPSPDDGGRHGRLGWFAMGGRYDKAVPSGRVMGVLEDVTGEGSRPPAGATLDEVTGMLVSWAAAEAHACAGKLAAIREILRREAGGEPGAPSPHGLPGQWDIGVAHEVAAALGLSWQAAEPLVGLAYDLEARLPRTGGLLDSGVLHWQKAKLVADEFACLDEELAGRAETTLLDRILTSDGRLRDDMTPARLRRLCQRIVIELGPEGAARRREAAEKEGARVQFFAEHGGSGALFATGLPPDEALRSEANIAKRAEEYRGAGIYPGESMDLLRVLALIDTINGRSLGDRIALWNAGQDGGGTDGSDDGTYPAGHENGAAGNRDSDGDGNQGGGEDAGGNGRDGDSGDDRDAGDDGDSGDDGGGGGDDGDRSGPRSGPAGAPAGQPDPGLPSLVHLTLPLATLQGLADRPGEAPRYGALDPDLARRIGEAAAASGRSRFCLTITDEDGHAAYHGCARLIRGTGNGPARPGNTAGTGNTATGNTGTGNTGGTGNRDGPGAGPPGGWDLAPDRTRAGPRGGRGAWILTVPGGRHYRIDLHQVPVTGCDHRYETRAYRPGRLLRHLVQVRDGECTSVSCSMPAWRCDFEHAIPYEKGGRTDACNAGARSRRCHQVKQSRGWTVTQPRPGWHQWRAPSGRTYVKGPMEYPS